MPGKRILLGLALLTVLILTSLCGCGNSPASPESSWREEVDSSLHNLEAATSFRYRLSLEGWIGVSGQSIYGDERGEGSCVGKDYSIQLLRTSPAGNETLAVVSQGGQLFLQEDNLWKPIQPEEIPSPLCDPRSFPKLATGYNSISLEGDEERGGISCRRYLLQLSVDKARDALGSRAWSYFSQMRYEMNCRIWVGDTSAPPVSMQLEVVGFDPEESVQRYRQLSTMDPYDLDSPDIIITTPDISKE